MLKISMAESVESFESHHGVSAIGECLEHSQYTIHASNGVVRWADYSITNLSIRYAANELS